MYLAEEDDGTYTAIDGKQRLRAIAEFMSSRMRLRNLERLDSAEGLSFGEMPEEIANALRLRPYIRVVTLLKQTHASLKYEVFLRLNRGGEILNPQEIRNVAFRGPLNSTIYELSENAFLKQQLKITGPTSSAFKDMSDAEYVLRFLTLHERLPQFSGKLAHEMNDFMEKYQRAKKPEIQAFAGSFTGSISRCEQLWGDNAFKRPESNGWRDQLLAGMFDAQMLSVAELSESQMKKLSNKTAGLAEGTRKLFDDAEFEKAVRAGTNTPARIKYRVQQVRNLLQAI